MTDLSPEENPYKPPAADDRLDGRITSYQGMIDHAKKHQYDSLLCNFLLKLNEKSPDAAPNFLVRFIKTDPLPTDALQIYYIQPSGAGQWSTTSVEINEPELFRESCKEIAKPPRRTRRQFMHALGEYGIGLAIGSSLYTHLGYKRKADRDPPDSAEQKFHQAVADSAFVTAVISGLLLSLAAEPAIREEVRRERHEHPPNYPTIEDFNKFVDKADKKLGMLAEQVVKDTSSSRSR